MATFSGNAAGYRIDVLEDGRIRLVDIDLSDGDTGSHVVRRDGVLRFDDRYFQLAGNTEERVNATPYAHQLEPAIAALADGGYVVTWTSDDLNQEYNKGIYAQRYDAGGNKIGGEIHVNANDLGYQNETAITGLTDGGYVVTWTSSLWSSSSGGIFAQHFDAAGNKMGEELLISAPGVSWESSSAVTTLTGGGYVISWKADIGSSRADIYAQQFDAAGNVMGGPMRVNTDIAYMQAESAVTALADGGYVITWMSLEHNVANYGIHAQRFDALGHPQGTETLVNTTPVGYFPDITALSGGGYVIAWIDGKQGIFTQHFDASGNKAGGEIHVDITGGEYDYSPTLAALPGGGYVLAWIGGTDDFNDPNNEAIYVQCFDAAGNAVGEEVRVSTVAPHDRSAPDVVVLADGGFVVTWESDGQEGSYSDSDIYVRRFDANGESVTTGVVLSGTNNADVMNGGLGMQLFKGLDGDDALAGGYGGDVLQGGSGNDTLSGDRGRDSLDGGAGDDFLNGGDGRDFLDGDEGTDVLNGGDGKDILHGGNGNDDLNGGSGDDLLIGSNGHNTLTGGEGRDAFEFGFAAGSNIDTITDFSSADGDMIQLRAQGFSQIGEYGTLQERYFTANAEGQALDANDRFIYETDTGKLFYDVDGSGMTVKVEIAVLLGAPALTAYDFFVA